MEQWPRRGCQAKKKKKKKTSRFPYSCDTNGCGRQQLLAVARTPYASREWHSPNLRQRSGSSGGILGLPVCHVSLWFLRDPTPGSAGVFTCYHRIVLVTLPGLGCKGIRDWLLSLWVDAGLSMAWVLYSLAEGMQPDPSPLDIEIQHLHHGTLNTGPLNS